MTYTIAASTEKSPDDGQRNRPKRVEFYSKNKFEKLVHLVGFIIRLFHNARSPERQRETEWFLEPVWTFWIRDKTLATTGLQTSDLSVRGKVALLTTPSRPPLCLCRSTNLVLP